MKKNKPEEKTNPYQKNYSLLSNIVYISKNMLKSCKALWFLIPLGIVCGTTMRFLWTFFAKYILDIIINEQPLELLIIAAVVGFSVQLVSTAANTFYSEQVWWRLLKARMDLLLEKNTKVMATGFENLENPDFLDMHQKASNSGGGNNKGLEGMMRHITNGATSLAIIAVSIAIMGTLSLWIVLAIIVLSTFQFLIVNTAKKIDKKKVWDPLAQWWRKEDYMADATTNFDAAKDIRMFSLGGWLINKYREINSIRYQKQKQSQKYWSIASLLNQLLWGSQQVVVYVWLVSAVLSGSVDIAEFTLYVGTAQTFYEILSSLLNNIADMKNCSREVNDFRTFIEYPCDIHDDHRAVSPVPDCKEYSFTFENVSFKYPNAEKYALKNMNIKLEAGKRLAVVGMNGAGKSTFIKLLLRLYEPSEGRILLNGVDIREYDKLDYYKRFSPVFQDVEIFAFTLSQNVSMQADSETDDNKSENCLRMAGMNDKLDKLEKGVQTEMTKVLFDDGVDLSGGEKQKLALARALYKDAPVVVLDEPTAALDALAEYNLYQNFDKLIGNKTAVYISHRLSSTRFCDSIAMFKEGKMVEYGTHEELLAKNGDYAEIFAVQAQYYVDQDKEAAVNA